MITIRTRISYLLILLLAAVVHHYNTVEKTIYIYTKNIFLTYYMLSKTQYSVASNGIITSTVIIIVIGTIHLKQCLRQSCRRHFLLMLFG